MSQRYFLTAESTYEDLRQSLNAALAYPNALGKSVFQTALYAPRDSFRRVLLAVDTDLPGYAAIDAAISPLLASDAMEEIDEANYLAAVATAGDGAGADVSIDTTAADILSASSGSITADDPGADRLVFWDDSAGKLTHLTVGSGLSISGTTLSSTASGTKSFAKFTPADNNPPATNFATLDTRNSVLVLEFDAATDESAVFVGYIPEGATLTNGLKVRLSWMADTATSGNVRWGVQFEADGTDLDADSFDTATLVTSAANGTSGIETVAEITATAIDSLAAGDRFRLKVYRDADDATNDTMTGDAQLVAVEVQVA